MTAKKPELEKGKKSEISLQNLQKRVPVDAARLKRAARRMLGSLGIQGSALSIAVVDDDEITRLNRRYFHRNRPTNVISFPMDSGDSSPLPHKILGDVVISADTAVRHAEEAGSDADDEILFLLIHGILHLAGYDHEKDAAGEKEMEAKERELFCLLARRSSRSECAKKGRGRSHRKPS
ncbi:MAG TPA: rRNA maturation RNase YbeY, partial [Thermodesulfobacteriota bacterium]|nr:rRNA maturation RNase YbeY [Thermodesulfobacteriota bacterium]